MSANNLMEGLVTAKEVYEADCKRFPKLNGTPRESWEHLPDIVKQLWCQISKNMERYLETGVYS